MEDIWLKYFVFCAVLICMSPSMSFAKEPSRVRDIFSGPLPSFEHVLLLAAQLEDYFKGAGVMVELVGFSSDAVSTK